jgi:signal transduction histidine kinase
VPVFDWRELRRWGISETSLPRGSEVRFREPTFWQRYTGQIVLVISALLAQGVIISLLLANRAKRRRAEQSLRESSNRLRAILDVAVEGIISISDRGIIESANAATERIFGCTTEELIGQNINMLMPSLFREEHNDGTANPMAECSQRVEELLPCTLDPSPRAIRLEGQLSSRPLELKPTRAAGKPPLQTTARAEGRVNAHSNSTVSGPLNENFANSQGRGSPTIIGVGREVSGRRKDGSEFPIHLVVSEIVLADRRVFTCFVRDITERKQAERTARELSGRLITAQEAERARLARELHDDITQRLARLAIDAGRAECDRAGRGRTETMRELRDGLVRLSEDVHSLSYKLHPALLEDLGLVDALRAECERFSRQESISVGVKLEETPAGLQPDTGLCLFRVTQEALCNVARHARAEAVTVSLRPLDGGLQLVVTDTGVGFDPGHQRQRPSLGLSSMRERVGLLGGELDVESAPGHGTTIVAWVPLNGARP